MWKSKRKLLIENLTLKERVKYLENIICPCQQHEYVKVGFALVGGTGHGDETTIYHYQCRKCGKTVSTYKVL